MRLRITFAALSLALLTVSAHAETAEEFFASRQLKMLVGFGPGTGNDIYMRHVARFLGKHLPGNPTILPVNMPGAASLVMLNYMANVAPRDGSVIGMPSRNLLTEPLFGNEQAKFDARQLTYIGSVSRDTALCSTWHTSGIKTIEDAKRDEVLVGSTGPSSGSSIFPRLLNALFKTRFKAVTGYPDSAAIGIAMERGEVKGYCSFPLSGMRSARPNWISDKLVNMLVQLTTRAHPQLPDVPLVMDLAKTSQERQALNLVLADQEMARVIAGPPDMPADRLAVWRSAFEKMLKDTQFMQEAAKLSLDVDGPIDGPAVEKIVHDLYSTPASVIQQVRAIREGTD